MALLDITLQAAAAAAAVTMAAVAEHQHKITDQDGPQVVVVARPFLEE
jgi:hypothetical protein